MYRFIETRFVPAIVDRSKWAMILAKVPKWMYSTPLRRWMGRYALLLTTKGRRTGNPHTVALDYLDVDGSLCVMSGWKGDTDWCKNLRANPEVEVQLGAEKSRRVAVELDEADRYRMHDRVREALPNLTEFIDPEDPVFRLDPA